MMEREVSLKMNLENLRTCIEQSPVLRYTYRTKTDCCRSGAVQSVVTEGSWLVNYEEKTAVSTTKTFTEEGPAVIEKAVYRDCKVIKSVIQEGVLTEDILTPEENLLSEGEYNALFHAKGALRPVNFDRLTLQSSPKQLPNTLSFIVEPQEMPELNEVKDAADVRSSATISLCSEDTMKLTQLSAFLPSENPQDMTLMTHNMTVYL